MDTLDTRMKTGIFGGSFNPVHLGHYEIVNQLILHNKVDQVIVVPAYQNPLKKAAPTVPEKSRLEMLRKTFAKLPNVIISDYELKAKGLSYTYTTLEHFRNEFPNDQLYWIMGEDSYAQFDRWAEPNRILELAKLLIFHRPAQKCKEPNAFLEQHRAAFEWVPVKIPEFSSTEIRDESPEAAKDNRWLHPACFNIWKEYKNTLERGETITNPQ